MTISNICLIAFLLLQAADCLPLAADAAETTLTLVTLQEWITEQQHITKE